LDVKFKYNAGRVEGYIKKKMPQTGQNILTMNLFHGNMFKNQYSIYHKEKNRYVINEIAVKKPMTIKTCFVVSLM
jgi:hypothetical protein